MAVAAAEPETDDEEDKFQVNCIPKCNRVSALLFLLKSFFSAAPHFYEFI